MKYVILILSIFLASACKTTGQDSSQKASGKKLDLNVSQFVESFKKAESPILLDVRTPNEWASGTLPGAKTINLMDPEFASKVAEFDKSKPIYVHCAVGGRSSKASKILEKQGFNVINLKSGGYKDLKSKILSNEE